MRIVATSYRSRWNNWRKHISYTFLLYIEETCSALRAISTSAVVRFIGECLITAFLAIMVAMAILSCQEPPKQFDRPDWCESHFCMAEATVFTPAGEGMYDLVREGLDRISKATGRYDLRTDVQEGIPVIWTPGMHGKLGKMCGRTDLAGFIHDKHGTLQSQSSETFTQLVNLNPDPAWCGPFEVSLLHELIHALAPKADHVATDDSIFSELSHTEYLDERALVQLCSEFDCLEFNPEESAP